MTSRRTLPPRAAYALAAAVIGLALYASATPSPLYATYRALWGFSPVVLTLVYAVYALGVLTSLVLAGRLSDHVGRRPVLVVALGTLMATSVLFMLADGVAWLFVARALQGLATGLALGAAGAALLDLHPRRDPAGAGLTNAISSSLGIGLGILVSSLLVQLAPAPRVLPFVGLLVLFTLAFLAALVMPEPVAVRTRPRLTPQRPSVPAPVRRPFLLATLAVLSSWTIGGLFLALGPQLAATIFDSTNHVVTGSGVVVLAATGAAAQVLFGRAPAALQTTAGAVALAAGMLLLVAATAARSPVLFLAGAAIGGGGFGVAFLGGLRALSVAIPHEQRGAVMSAFYLVAYLAISVPAVIAGVVVTSLGLASTFEIFGSVVAGIALLAAAEAWRTRPASAPAPVALATQARG